MFGWTIREERAEYNARQSSLALLVTDFHSDLAVIVDEPRWRAAVLEHAHRCVAEHLADPSSAQYSDEVVKQPPNGFFIAIGRVDAVAPNGRQVSNWYAFACDPELRPNFVELLSEDPRSGTP